MDVVTKLATEIARAVVPDEIHDAPLIAENFAKGGRQRKELLQHSQSGELGGFGINGEAVFPWILHMMAVASPFLAGLLASKTLSNSGIFLQEIRSALHAQKSQVRATEERHEQGSSSLEHQSTILPKQLHQCVSSMSAALQKCGMSPQESEKIAYKVLLVLWEDAPNALLFLKKITEKK